MTKIEPVGTALIPDPNGTPVVLWNINPKQNEMLYTEAQMRQLGEACAKQVELANSNMSQLDNAAEIRELIKEMLG